MNKGRYELKGYTQHGFGLDEPCLNKNILKEKGLTGLAITDPNTVAGWCDGPIFGDEDFRFLYGVDVQIQKRVYIDEILEKGSDDDFAARATLLAKNEAGKRNLLKILFEASSRAKNLSAYPIVEIDILERHRDEILVGYSCDNNILTEEDPDVDAEFKESSLTRMIDLFDYVEVAPADYNPLFPYIDLRKEEYVQEYTKRLIEYAEDHGKPVVAVSSFRYLDKDEELSWRILQCDGEISASEGHHIAEYGMVAHLRTTEEMLDAFHYLGNDKAKEIVIDNTIRIANEIDDFNPTDISDCRIRWEDAEEMLNKRVDELLPARYDGMMIANAKKRAAEELEWIIGNGYTESFVMLADAVSEHSVRNWDHSAYGELGNSIIAYILGISSIDPICNGLPFAFFTKAAEDSEFHMSLSVPQSQRLRYESSLGKMRGVNNTISGTESMQYRKKEVREMLNEYERISGKQISWEDRGDIEEALTGLTSPLRYSAVPFYLLPKGKEGIIDRRWSGDDLVSDYLGWHSVNKEFTSFVLASDEREDVLLNLERITGKPVTSIDFQDRSMMPAFDYAADRRSPKWTAGIYWEKYNPAILRFGIGSFEDMVRIEGFGSGKGTWDQIQLELLERGEIHRDKLITCREDVYDLLISKSIAETEALCITGNICKGFGVKDSDVDMMLSHGITEQEIHILKHILYLPLRADCIRMARIRFWLAYYKMNHPKQFYSVYLECIADDREWTVIKGRSRLVEDAISLIRDYGDPTYHEQADWSDFEMSARALIVADEMYRRGIRIKHYDNKKKRCGKWLLRFSRKPDCI